jgi:ankyrin repeat protein
MSLPDWEKMHSLVRENKIAELENFKEHFAKTDENQENLFHSAAYSGDEKTWLYLWRNGLNNIEDINRMNQWNTCPIQIACAKDNSAALHFLLCIGAKDKVVIDRETKSYRGSFGLLYGGSQYVNGHCCGGSYLFSLGDNLLHICIRAKAKACLLMLCERFIDHKILNGRDVFALQSADVTDATAKAEAKAGE